MSVTGSLKESVLIRPFRIESEGDVSRRLP